jgi:hypothetical protein
MPRSNTWQSTSSTPAESSMPAGNHERAITGAKGSCRSPMKGPRAHTGCELRHRMVHEVHAGRVLRASPRPHAAACRGAPKTVCHHSNRQTPGCCLPRHTCVGANRSRRWTPTQQPPYGWGRGRRPPRRRTECSTTTSTPTKLATLYYN